MKWFSSFCLCQLPDCNRHAVPFAQVGRAGRFGTKGLAITFVASETDSAVLNSVQVRSVVAMLTPLALVASQLTVLARMSNAC